MKSKFPPTSFGEHKPNGRWEHFSIGTDLIPREMIASYAILKKAAAEANHAGGRLKDEPYKLIVQVCDEISSGSIATCFRCMSG